MQEKTLNTKERILHFAGLQEDSKRVFFEKIGSVYGNFTGKSKNSEPSNAVLREILLNYPEINPDWLITGRGEMLRSSNNFLPISDLENQDLFTDHLSSLQGFPLVFSQHAIHFGDSVFSIAEKDIKERYTIPAFKHKQVDFMIEIEGPSMYPKFNSGDIVACNIIKEPSFLQWNRIHVVATKTQGILTKRIHEGANGAIRMISENPKYPPFEIPKDQIRGIALVVGVICLE